MAIAGDLRGAHAPARVNTHVSTDTAALGRGKHNFRPCLRCRPELAPGQRSGRYLRAASRRRWPPLIDEGGFMAEAGVAQPSPSRIRR